MNPMPQGDDVVGEPIDRSIDRSPVAKTWRNRRENRSNNGNASLHSSSFMDGIQDRFAATSTIPPRLAVCTGELLLLLANWG